MVCFGIYTESVLYELLYAYSLLMYEKCFALYCIALYSITSGGEYGYLYLLTSTSRTADVAVSFGRLPLAVRSLHRFD